MNFYNCEPFINFESNLALFEENNELDTYTNYFSNDNQLSTTILLPSFDKANTLTNQGFANKNVLTNELQTHENSYEINSNEQPLFYSSLTEQKMTPVWLNNDLQTQTKTDFETQNQMFNLVQPTNEPLLNFSNVDLGLPSNESPKPFQMEQYETENAQLDFNSNNKDKDKNKNTNTNTNTIGTLKGNVSFINRNQEIGFDFLNYANEISDLPSQSLTKEKTAFSPANNSNSKAQRKRFYEENEDESKKEAKTKSKTKIKRTNSHPQIIKAKKIRRKTKSMKERKKSKRRTEKPSSKKTKSTTHSTKATTKPSKNSILRHRRKKKSQKKNKNDEFEVNSIIIPTEKGKRVKIIKRKKPTRSSRLKTSEYGKKLFESWFKKHLNKPEGPYPDKNTRKMMSEKTGIPELQVTRWFGQRRRLQRMLCEKNSFTKPNWID
ncbi:hypothetical protein M0812_04002 [Anaeramoeba flamelloides]|uniref:Homeobox domain-containing protein n=1 Tax=Anaeramoeba flamelloides TaxID=1746091 RepID=A0AAV8AIL5_9EUKA|nr:hypothetical protein M0812_04002 [Anaeramoeba flamelloides]